MEKRLVVGVRPKDSNGKIIAVYGGVFDLMHALSTWDQGQGEVTGYEGASCR